MSNVAQFPQLGLTDQEQEVVVNIHKQTTFTEDHLKTYDELRNLANYPRIYGSQAPRGIIFDVAGLIDLDKIEDNNKFYEQVARFSVNPEESNIEEDITTNLFSLNELGIMVMKHPKKEGWYIILEGRTRFRILKKLGMTNIIADIFEEATPAEALRFATSMNAQKKPFGKASWVDIMKTILQLIKMGEIANRDNTVAGRQALVDDITTELQIITTRLKPQQIDLIVHAAVEEGTGISPVISFPLGKGADEWLVENGYIGNKELVYITVSAFIEKAHQKIITVMNDEKYKDMEVRFIFHCGVPESKNTSKYWEHHVKNFGPRFKEYEIAISNARFGGAEIVEGNYKIYGGIPQVRELNHKYKMDRLVVY